jgi:hypothetical protein
MRSVFRSIGWIGLLAASAAPAATLIVTNGNDAGTGSLRNTVNIAASGDLINFAVGVTDVVLTSGQISIDKNLDIVAGAAVVIRRDGPAPDQRLLAIGPGNAVFIRNLEFRNGRIANTGGAIFNQGALSLDLVRFQNNQSTAGLGGGAIANSGSLQVANSTFVANTSNFAGGAIVQGNGGTMVINSSFFADNIAAQDGGAVTSQSVSAPALVTIANSTFARNIAPTGAGVITVASGASASANMTIVASTFVDHFSGGAAVSAFVNSGAAQVSLRNNVLARTAGANVQTVNGAVINSLGNNLSDDASFGIAGDLINTDPLIGALGNYGGATQTYPLLPGSPAIDAGSSAGMPTVDSRGISRPQLGAFDIGAFESRGFAMTVTGGNNQIALINTAFASPLAANLVANAPIEPVQGGQVRFVVPLTGASALIPVATINAAGNAASTATANLIPGGFYSVTGEASGASSVNYALRNIAPVISIANASIVEGNGGTTSLQFTLTATPAVSVDTTVDFATGTGSATPGADYTPLADQRTFLVGQSAQTVSIAINPDLQVEPDEAFAITISNPSAGATLGTASATGSIVDDDSAVVAISNASVVEGLSGPVALSFSAALSQPVQGDVSFDFASADGSNPSPTLNATLADGDYVATSGTVALPATGGTNPQSFVINVSGDGKVEPDQLLDAVFSGLTLPSGINAGRITLGSPRAVGTIQNDDSAQIAVADVSVIEGNAGTRTLDFSATLSAPIEGAVSFPFNSADGDNANPALNATLSDSDYQVASGTVTFASTSTLPQSFSVTVNGDIEVEPDQALAVFFGALSLPFGVSPGAVTLASNRINGTIQNDDAAGLSIADAGIVEGDSGSANLSFTVTLSAPSKSTVTVQAATVAGTATSGVDFTAVNAPLQFDPGVTTQTLLVPIVGDAVVEANEQFTVVLSAAVGATISDDSGVGTITDNDTATIAIADASFTEGNAGQLPSAFSISLSAPVQGGVSVTANTADGANVDPLRNATVADGDYLALSNSTVNLTGSAGVVVVTRVGDLDVEPNQSFRVLLSNIVLPPGVALAAVSFADADALGTLLNDDGAALSIAAAQADEGNSGARTLSFPVSLSATNKDPVSVSYATTDATAQAGSDYVAASGTVQFLPGQTTQTILVTINGDAVFENDETLSLSLSAPSNATIGAGSAIGTILNDDLAPQIAIDDARIIEGNSGLTTALISLRRTGLSALGASVAVNSEADSATAPADFEAYSGVVNFAPTEALKFIQLRIVGDSQIEPDEFFKLRLSAPVNATLASAAPGAVTIVNDDGEVVQLSACGARVEEAANTVTIGVTRVGANPLDVSWFLLPISATAGQDYLNASGNLSWAANDVSPRSVVISILDDALVESPESFTLALGKVSPGGMLGTPNVELITILDNDERLFGDGLELPPCLP